MAAGREQPGEEPGAGRRDGRQDVPLACVPVRGERRGRCRGGSDGGRRGAEGQARRRGRGFRRETWARASEGEREREITTERGKIGSKTDRKGGGGGCHRRQRAEEIGKGTEETEILRKGGTEGRGKTRQMRAGELCGGVCRRQRRLDAEAEKGREGPRRNEKGREGPRRAEKGAGRREPHKKKGRETDERTVPRERRRKSWPRDQGRSGKGGGVGGAGRKKREKQEGGRR